MSDIFYIGGYQKDDAYCLHCCEYSGSAMRILSAYEVSNASYLCLSPNKKYLYAVIETNTFKGVKGGGVAAFAIEAGGKLRFINDAPTEGEHPCHVSVSRDGRSLYVANYTGGSSTFFNVLDNGGIGAKTAFIDHNKCGIPSMAVASRQANPHAHFIQPFGDIGWQPLWVCDLGLDALLVFNDMGNELTRLAMPGGFGLRHIAFHHCLPVAYVVGELSAEVIAVEYTINANAELILKAGLPVSVLPSPDAKVNCAAIRVSPDGRHVLVSNRGGGADSMVVLKLDNNGSITGLSNIHKTRGVCPRDFAFTPEGDGIVVAYQDSEFAELLIWDGSGKLTPTAVELAVTKPTCVLFQA